MKGRLFFTLLYLFTTAWAGGYQGCLERVWVYQAYLIDSLNDYDKQTIGWQCKGKNWDNTNKKCAHWQRMTGSKPGQTLTYDQFVHNLGGAPDRTGWSVYSGDKLDVEETALQTYKKYTTPKPGQPAGSAKVKNFAAQLAVKETWEWNQCIKKVGEVVDATYRAHASSLTAEQRQMFTAFDDSRELVSKARAGDHGPYLITAAKTSNKLTGIDIKTQNLGTSPADGKALETLDIAETIKEAVTAGVSDPRQKVIDFLDEWYGNGPGADINAKQHRAVMNSYKQVKDGAVACGRP